MKIKVILVSKPLTANKAVTFKKSFEDLFDGKFIFSGKYSHKRKGVKIPLYYVGYLSKKQDPELNGSVCTIDRSKLLSNIPPRRANNIPRL